MMIYDLICSLRMSWDCCLPLLAAFIWCFFVQISVISVHRCDIIHHSVPPDITEIYGGKLSRHFEQFLICNLVGWTDHLCEKGLWWVAQCGEFTQDFLVRLQHRFRTLALCACKIYSNMVTYSVEGMCFIMRNIRKAAVCICRSSTMREQLLEPSLEPPEQLR